MVDLFAYADEALPAAMKCQILAAHQMEWPGGYVGPNRLRDWVQRPWFHPTHVVLVEQGVLIAYAGVAWKRLTHAGETYTTYGLSGVSTCPAFRRRGHGRRVVEAATALIRRSDADVGLFTCASGLTGFYAAAGWELVAGATLHGGPRDAPVPTQEQTMMGFFTEKGRRGRAAFASAPIVFDDDLW